MGKKKGRDALAGRRASCVSVMGRCSSGYWASCKGVLRARWGFVSGRASLTPSLVVVDGARQEGVLGSPTHPAPLDFQSPQFPRGTSWG